MSRPSFRLERSLFKKGYNLIAGLDEAGRGPLAGPVVAAAVILAKPIKGLNDSKKLSPKRRAECFLLIKRQALAIGVGVVSPQTVDRLNIYQATRRAMKLAVRKLARQPDYLIVDGRLKLDLEIAQQSLVKGDSKSSSIAAASIIAKVTRDQLMLRYHQKYPHYGFDRHKGYGTRLHFDKLKEHGPCQIHRQSFSFD